MRPIWIWASPSSAVELSGSEMVSVSKNCTVKHKKTTAMNLMYMQHFYTVFKKYTLFLITLTNVDQFLKTIL